MVDYVGIAVNGFCTGFGVIFANEVWKKLHSFKKKYNKHLKNFTGMDIFNGE